MGKNFLKLLKIDDDLSTPIYRQLVDGIVKGVKTKWLVEGDILPSLHDLHIALEISKSSVYKAYRKLKADGVIGSEHGRCYYVKATQIDDEVNDLDAMW